MTSVFLEIDYPTGKHERMIFSLNRLLLYPNKRFLLAGNGWGDKPKPNNVNYLGHLYCSAHNSFNRSSLAVLNVNRDSMAKYGFSPATRIFEAAGAGACLISDYWDWNRTVLRTGQRDPFGKQRK